MRGYEAINEHGYCDINLCADTIPEPRKDIQMKQALSLDMRMTLTA